MMKPDPSEVPRRCCCSPPFLSKNSLNSSSNGEPGGSCGRSRSRGPCWGTFWVVVMLTTEGSSLSTRSAKLSGASRATAGCARTVPNATTAATAAARKNPENSERITSDLQRRSRRKARSGRRRVFEFLSTWRPNVAQIKRPLCCCIFQLLRRFAPKGGAAWQACHSARAGLLLACHPRRVVEVAEEVVVGAQDHRPARREGLLVGLHAPPEG